MSQSPSDYTVEDILKTNFRDGEGKKWGKIEIANVVTAKER